MRLGARLVLFIALASLVPLGLLGLGAIQASSKRMMEEVGERQGTAVDGLAVYVETWLGLQFRLLSQQSRVFDLRTLDAKHLEIRHRALLYKIKDYKIS